MNPSKFFLYGCGQLGIMGLARYFFQWVLHFGEHGGAVGLTAATVGYVFFAFRLFDSITDPIAGVLSDVWVRKGRERRTLLWFSFLLPPIGLALVFAPGASLPVVANWVLLGAGMFVFFIGYTLYAIPYWSLMDDYSRGDMPTRAKLSNILGAGLLVATGVGFVASPALVERYGHLVGAIVFAVPATLLMVLPYFAQPAAMAAAVAKKPDQEESLTAGFRIAFRHKRFIAVIILFAGGQMSFTVMTAAAPFIAVQLLGGTLSDVASLLGPFLLMAIPAFAFVPNVVKRYGWEKTTLIATTLLGVVYAGTGLLGAAIVGTPVHTAMIVFALGGPMAAALLGLEGEAITSCASEHKQEVTAVYFGVYNFIVKAANGLALVITGYLSSMAEHGTGPIRMMGFSAGGLLVCGVIGYVVLRPKSLDPKSPGPTSPGNLAASA